jgi:opacity protein-like surface antigen
VYYFETFKRGLVTAVFLLAAAIPATLSTVTAHAQDEEVDAYDPFIDYSEYEEANEEEADINFFRNGRFLTMGFSVGQRMFTEGMADHLKQDVAFGLFLSYFFDLRFALQFGYLTGSHALKFDTTSGQVTGTADMSSINVDIKYYVNTQNVTKGLASFNPYFLGGISSVNREVTAQLNNVAVSDIVSDRATGFDVGAGIEFPMMRNKMYFGGQALYQLVSFKDENQILTGTTNKYMNGDLITLTAILGVNF